MIVAPHCRAARTGARTVLFLALAMLLACGREPGKKSLADRWLEGVEAMGKSDPIVDVVLYFDNQWHAVAYEVLAERTLAQSDRPVRSLEALFAWFDSVEREARERFNDRYGFYPPDYFPPRAPHEVTDFIPDSGEFSWALSALEWEKILKGQGLTRPEDVPAYLERRRAAGAVLDPGVADPPEPPPPGTYVELFYGRKSGGPANHPQLVEQLGRDPLIRERDPALSIVCIAGLDRTEAESFRVEAERASSVVEIVPCEQSGAVLVGPLDEDGVISIQHLLPNSGRYLHLYAEARRVREFRVY